MNDHGGVRVVSDDAAEAELLRGLGEARRPRRFALYEVLRDGGRTVDARLHVWVSTSPGAALRLMTDPAPCSSVHKGCGATPTQPKPP